MKLKIGKIIMVSAVTLSATLCLSGCRKEVTPPTMSEIFCDASFENIIEQEIDVFEYVYSEQNKSIIPEYVDQSTCIKQFLDSGARMIVITHPLTENQIKYVREKFNRTVRQSKIAIDAIALIVNPKNGINALTENDLKEILSGQIVKWEDVDPLSSGLDSIKVVFDHQGSSTVQYMRDKLLDGGLFGKNVYAQGSPEKVFEIVEKDKNAIGIIGVSWLTTNMRGRTPSKKELAEESKKLQADEAPLEEDAVKVLGITTGEGSVKPYQRYIMYGEYPFTRQIWMITTGAPRSVTHNFYAFVTGPEGQKLMQVAGVLPAQINLAPIVELK